MDFFVFGAPKSGTTWLQSIIDSHTDVCCRPEDQLKTLFDTIPDILEQYNRLRVGVNERTAKYTLTDQLDNADAAALFINTVELMKRKSKKQVVGTKDNGLFMAPGLAQAIYNLFPEARFIHIIRDIRDVVVSSWHHNMRVEDNFIARAHSLEDWCKDLSRQWDVAVGEVEKIPDRIMTVKFEDLKQNGVAEAKRIFDFLGVDNKQAAGCIEKTKFEKKQKTGNQFYRKGEAGTWRELLDEGMVNSISAAAGGMMEKYGYGGE